MDMLLQRYRQLWTSGAYLSSLAGGAAMFLCGSGFMIGARAYLLHTAYHTVSSPDLLLDWLPVMDMENFLVWGVPLLIGIMAGVLLAYPERMPFTLKAIGLLFFIRSFFVVLTPMGIRPDQVITVANGFFQRLAYSSNDFFFSGHVSLPFLFALIFHDQKLIRAFMLGATGLFGMGVLLAHTHYSIDVFAVPFMVPTIQRLSVLLFGTETQFLPAQKRTPAPVFVLPEQPGSRGVA